MWPPKTKLGYFMFLQKMAFVSCMSTKNGICSKKLRAQIYVHSLYSQTEAIVNFNIKFLNIDIKWRDVSFEVRCFPLSTAI